MRIEHGSDKDHPHCEECGNPARYTVVIGKFGIPVCQNCMKVMQKKFSVVDVDGVDRDRRDHR